MPDFFPLKKGSVRVYAMSSAEGSGVLTIEVLSVSKRGPVTVARCRRTSQWTGKPAKSGTFTVTKDSKGVRSGREVEYAAPVKVGTKWAAAQYEYRIESLSASTRTRAGSFRGCLRVAYLIAGGDSGSGERFYAPGVGLVKAGDSDESDPWELELIEHR